MINTFQVLLLLFIIIIFIVVLDYYGTSIILIRGALKQKYILKSSDIG